MKTHTISWRKISDYLTGMAVLVMLFVFILLFIPDNIEKEKTRSEFGYQTITDCVCTEQTDEDAPIGIKKEYRFKIDGNIEQDITLAFYTVHQYVDVWIGQEYVYGLKPSPDRKISKTVGSNWIMIPVYREDFEKEVRIEITPVYESFRNREVEFLLGSGIAIYKNRLLKDLPQLILSVMAIFVGLIYMCVAGYNQLRKKRGKGLIFLGVFSMMMGIWRLTDTRFTPFLFPNHPVLVFYISVCMLMLGMIPLIKWMEEYYSEENRKRMNIYNAFSVIVCLIQLILQLIDIADLRDMLFITHIVIGIGVFLVGFVTINEIVCHHDNSKIRMGSKLPCILVAGVVLDVIAFYLKGNSSELLFSLLAFLFYIVIMGIKNLFHYSEQELQLAEIERQLAEKERMLTKSRIASMMSQIRSHFIFNVLTTISGYCKIDPQKADAALIRFSRYLRKNIRIIEEEGLIDFETELEQLEDYVALEQMRFPDMIAFEKVIETMSFQIPPLTIQPLVENAIKHGLMEHNKCGVIRLTTMRKEAEVEITVSDNGIGFLPQDIEKNESIGIKNVRYRLENMVHGKLDIQSIQGEGTTVIITIPIGEELL